MFLRHEPNGSGYDVYQHVATINEAGTVSPVEHMTAEARKAVEAFADEMIVNEVVTPTK